MGARLLVLDDDPAVRLFLDKALSRAGYSVACAGIGSDALAMLERERFDLFIVDKNLPGENGLDVLAKALAIDPTLPAVLITAYPEPLFRRDIRLRAYLGKPFDSIRKVIDTVSRSVREPMVVDLPVRAERKQPEDTDRPLATLPARAEK